MRCCARRIADPGRFRSHGFVRSATFLGRNTDVHIGNKISRLRRSVEGNQEWHGGCGSLAHVFPGTEGLYEACKLAYEIKYPKVYCLTPDADVPPVGFFRPYR